MDALRNQTESTENQEDKLNPAPFEDFSEEEVGVAASAEELQVDEDEAIDAASEKPAVSIFDRLERMAMLDVFAKLLKEKPIQELRQEAEALKMVFYRKYKQEVEALRKAFVGAGNEAHDFVAQEDGLEVRLKEIYADYKAQRAAYAEKVEKEREENLRKKLAIIEELKALPERQDDFNSVFNDFKTLQAKWRAIGLVPQVNQNDVWKQYNHNVEKFYDMVKINKELRELDFKKNLDFKQQICEKSEALVLEENVVAAFKKLQQYHEIWREIGPVAPEFREPLWERFKEATARVNKRHLDYFEGLKAEQERNFELKTALCEKAEELLVQANLSVKDWTDHTNALVELQKMWKGIGFAPRKENIKVFQRFRTACSTFFENRRAFFKDVRTEFTNNLHQKMELCAQAEALAQSDEWKKTTDALIELQQRWKEIGAVSRNHSDAVWKRFRATCDTFFERKKQHFSAQDTQQYNNLKTKELLIAEMKAYQTSEGAQDVLSAIRAFQQRWSEIGFVPQKQKDKIQAEYKEAMDVLYANLRNGEHERRMSSFKSRVETSAKDDKRKFSQERDKLLHQAKRLEADIALWENNVGFFAKSKNAEKLIQDVKNNIEKAKRELALVEEKISLLDKA
ncbi:MAG: DUF349 domain-containing protein [Prevotellaceae bacterium]|jgi:hypothetical protein|nr:DUF349 domain-containing protein [Prevotellaceae bacterium]